MTEDNKIGTVVHENFSYVVQIAKVTMDKDLSKLGYGLTNKTTGIEEYQTFSLPAALQTAEDWDNKLQRDFHTLFSYQAQEEEQAAMAAQGDLLDSLPEIASQ